MTLSQKPQNACGSETPFGLNISVMGDGVRVGVEVRGRDPRGEDECPDGG